MTTTFQKYAPAIFSMLVLLLGGYQALQAAGYGLVAILQFVVLAATTATTYFVPMVGTRYAGWVKTSLEVVGVIATAVIPFVVNGAISRAQIILVVIAAVKALATHFGVVIRSDSTIDARETPAGQVPSITALSQQDRLELAASLQRTAQTEDDALVPGDGLRDTTAGKHSA